MAIVTIVILEGRDRETKDKLIKRLSDAVIDTLDARPEQVRVVIQEVRDGDYGVGGVPVHMHERE